MNRVYPIKDKNKIEALKELLRRERKYRELSLFVLGINTPLHIKDILSMRWNIFLTENYEIKEINTKIEVKEARTMKTKCFVITPSIYEALTLYFRSHPFFQKDDYIFISQKTKDGKYRPITTQYAWKLLNDYAKMVGINVKIGTHTLRKTYAYHLYKEGVAISYIRRVLNQSNISATLRYMDVDRDEYMQQQLPKRALSPNL